MLLGERGVRYFSHVAQSVYIQYCMDAEKRKKLKKLEKETVWKESKILVGAVSFFIFVLPYIVHLCINGISFQNKEEFGQLHQDVCIQVGNRTEHIQLELYLLGALVKSDDEAYEEETLKAIAVIIRSNAVRAILEGKALEKESFYTQEELRVLWGEDYEANLQRYRNVIVSTRGIVLFYDGDIVSVPFHRLSVGRTRDSSFLTEQVPYVVSVESSEDMYADDFFTTVEIKKSQLGEDFAVMTQDRWGYVISVKVNGEERNGEVFRKEWNLPSACFEYEVLEHTYLFRIRGIGHGMGMSLYGGNCLAQKGWDFAEILQYYYPGVEIRKENRSDVNA